MREYNARPNILLFILCEWHDICYRGIVWHVAQHLRIGVT